MFRPSGKFLLIGAAVAAMLLAGASQSDAFWGCYRPVCAPSYTACYTPCYTPCYVSCCTVSYDPCCNTSCGWYVGYRPGPIRRALFGPYRWYYGGSYVSSCYADVCCTDGESATATSVDASTPTRAEKAETPAEPETQTDPVPEPPFGGTDDLPPAPPTDLPGGPPPEPPVTIPGDLPDTTPDDLPSPFPGLDPEPPAGAEPPGFPSTGVQPTQENSGLLTIYVPYDAKVSINGFLTSTEGSRRKYVSYGLKSGFSYKYEVRAQIVRDGQRVEESRMVVLTAGGHQTVAFGFNPNLVEGLATR